MIKQSIHNSTLNHLYHDEKRKLEIEIIKDYYKDKMMNKILNMNE